MVRNHPSVPSLVFSNWRPIGITITFLFFLQITGDPGDYQTVTVLSVVIDDA
jgi:hypothetical protein